MTALLLVIAGRVHGESGQATLNGLVLKLVAEVQTTVRQGDRDITKLVPADRLVPGDLVLYTLQIRNPGPVLVKAPEIVLPVPAHVAYVADSATGPGAEVTYSVDGGHRFERPENLQAVDPDGRIRVAKPSEYTHIRWKIKNTIKVKSIAFARFRAVVK